MSPEERELLDAWCERLIPKAWKEHARLRALVRGDEASVLRDVRPWGHYEQEMACLIRLSTGEWHLRGFLGEFWTRPTLAELLPLAEQVLALGWAPEWGEAPEPGASDDAIRLRMWDSDWAVCGRRGALVRELQGKGSGA